MIFRGLFCLALGLYMAFEVGINGVENFHTRTLKIPVVIAVFAIVLGIGIGTFFVTLGLIAHHLISN